MLLSAGFFFKKNYLNFVFLIFCSAMKLSFIFKYKHWLESWKDGSSC